MQRPKSAAERKREERDRYRAAGLVLVQLWVRPQQREKLTRYVERLKKAAA
jgi:hypothetical protein